MSKQVSKKQKAAAKGLSNDYLYCRTVGHRWDRKPVDVDPVKTAWGTPLTFRCQGCGAARIDVIDRRGQVSYRMYRYGDGYHIPRKETPNRNTLRLEMLARD